MNPKDRKVLVILLPSSIALAVILTTMALPAPFSNAFLFQPAEGIAVPQNITSNATLNPLEDAVLNHLSQARAAVQNGNNTGAIMELIDAMELEHNLNAQLRTANLTTSAQSERNLGAMSNNTTGLNATALNPFD